MRILSSVLFFLVVSATGASADSLTLTTYYPSPSGSYQNLTAAGTVGIGTTAPTAPLEVKGAVKVSGALAAGSITSPGTLIAGAVTATSLTSTGAISGVNLSASGNVTAANLYATGVAHIGSGSNTLSNAAGTLTWNGTGVAVPTGTTQDMTTSGNDAGGGFGMTQCPAGYFVIGVGWQSNVMTVKCEQYK